MTRHSVSIPIIIIIIGVVVILTFEIILHKGGVPGILICTH